MITIKQLMAVRRSHLMLAASLCSVTTACSEKPQPSASAAPEVGFVALKAEAVTVSSELTGRTAATTASEVRPQVDGVVRARLFEEGSVVRAGQPLYEIDPRMFRASYNTSRAQLENAQATLFAAQRQADRYRTLSDNQAVSRQDIDNTVAAARQARAQVHQYEAAVETARLNLEYTRVLAPIGGRIGRSAVTPGALVTASQATPLASIQQLDPIFVDVTQSASDVMRLRQALTRGQVMPTKAPVRLMLEDGTLYPEGGTIEFGEVTVNPQAGTVTLRARFPNPQGLLMPGMFVRVRAPQGVVPNGILAPQQGITRDAEGNATALVIDTQSKVASRKVTTGQAVGNKWLVTGGLRAGDRLVVEGVDRAQVGATVRPVAVKLDD